MGAKSSLERMELSTKHPVWIEHNRMEGWKESIGIFWKCPRL